MQQLLTSISAASTLPTNFGQTTMAGAGTQPVPDNQGVVVSISAAGAAKSAGKPKEPDTTALTIKKTTPAQNKEKVSVTSKISISFDEKVVAGSGKITLQDDKGEVVAVYDIANSSNIKISGKNLTIKPSEKFQLGTTYTVTVESGVVKDLSGNALENGETFSFKTKPDTKAPKLIKFNPTKNPEGAVAFNQLTVVFDEKIQLLRSGTIQIQGAKKELIEVSLSDVQIEGNKLIINLHKSLSPDQKYKVVFGKATVADLVGNLNKGKLSYAVKAPSGQHEEVIRNDPGKFDISLYYIGNPDYLQYFKDAAEFWERVIIGDLPSAGGIDDLKINIRFKTMDGAYGRLAQAGPRQLRPDSGLPFTAEMEVDIADVSWMIETGIFLSTIIHEMGHALGIGTLWERSGLIDKKNYLYTGEKALAVYREIAGEDKNGVPIEKKGGKGTAYAHWSEEVFKTEIMTGWVDQGAKLSRVSIATLEDLGYTVDYSQAETLGLA